MAIVLTVGGVTKAIKAGTLNFSQSASAGDRFSCEIVSEDGSYRPQEGDEVIVTEDAVTIFGGLIVTPRERGVVGPFAPISTEIVCQGFKLLASGAYIRQTFATGGLYARLTTLAALIPGGVTVDAGQTNPGPTMTDVHYEWVSAETILDEWAKALGMVWRINSLKKLKMYTPSDEAAAFNVSDNGSDLIGDVTVEPAGAAEYCNRLILTCGTGTGLAAVTETFTQAAAETEYTMAYNVSQSIDDTRPSVLIVNGVSTEVISWGYDVSFQWWWDYENNKLVNEGAALTPGDVITVTYAPSTTVVIDDLVEQAAYGRRVDGVASGENVETIAQALELGNGILAIRIVRPVKATYHTRLAGLLPGTVQTVTVPMRNLSGSYQVVSINGRDDVDGAIRRAVTVSTYTGPAPTFQDTYHKWSGDGKASQGASYSISGVSSSGGLPVIFLGASASEWVESTSGPGWVEASAIQIEINTTERGSTTGTVYVRLRASAGTVTARLRDQTNGTTAGTSAVVSSTTYQTVAFAVTLTTGIATYSLELLPSIVDTPVNGVGYLK